MAEIIEQATAADHDGGVENGDRSPFKAARITEGYPFDETDQKVIKRFLSDVRRRQSEAARKALDKSSET